MWQEILVWQQANRVRCYVVFLCTILFIALKLISSVVFMRVYLLKNLHFEVIRVEVSITQDCYKINVL